MEGGGKARTERNAGGRDPALLPGTHSTGGFWLSHHSAAQPRDGHDELRAAQPLADAGFLGAATDGRLDAAERAALPPHLSAGSRISGLSAYGAGHLDR